MVKKIYSTLEFAKYLAMTGKDMQGGYVVISTKAIKNFGIDI
jgi:hypothetical protein